MVHPDNGILFNTKKKWAIKPWKKHRGNLNGYYQVKETNLKGHILYDSKYIKKSKMWEQWKDQWLLRVWGGGDE